MWRRCVHHRGDGRGVHPIRPGRAGLSLNSATRVTSLAALALVLVIEGRRRILLVPAAIVTAIDGRVVCMCA